MFRHSLISSSQFFILFHSFIDPIIHLIIPIHSLYRFISSTRLFRFYSIDLFLSNLIQLPTAVAPRKTSENAYFRIFKSLSIALGHYN